MLAHDLLVGILALHCQVPRRVVQGAIRRIRAPAGVEVKGEGEGEVKGEGEGR